MENAIKVNLVPAKVVQAKAQKPRIETLPYQKTKGNYGVQTKKVKKIPKFKELKLLPAASFEVKPDKKEKNVESTLDEKLERINILPYGKKELRDTLNDYSKVKSLSSEMTSWLNGNNSKFLEILNVFRKIGKKNCLTYAQFISTMINAEAPFRIKDLCALVIHLSSQKAGLIAEEDVEKITKNKNELTECNICGLGKSQIIQTKSGPFGTVQTFIELPVNNTQDMTNKWVHLFASSLIKKPKTIDTGKNMHFKSAFISWRKQKERFNKPSLNKEPSDQRPAFFDIAKRTIRTRDIISDWQKKTNKIKSCGEIKNSHLNKNPFEYQVEKNPPESQLKRNSPAHLANIDSLSRKASQKKGPSCWETIRDERKVRFQNLSAKVAADIKKKKNTPNMVNVVECAKEKFMTKKTIQRPKCQRLSFLKIPKEDDDLLTVFSQRQKQSVEFFVLLQLRAVIYDSVLSCPAHFSLLLDSDTALNYVAHHIKEVNDISKADIYISPFRFSFRQSLLPLENTLKECGYRGYCKSHPQKVTLYYDFDIIHEF